MPVEYLELSLSVQIAFWSVAILFSIFFGLRATQIFQVDSNNKPWSWRFHQFWLNFLGSLVGWTACALILPEILQAIIYSLRPNVTFSHIFLFFVAFIGMTGFLPVTVIGTIAGLKEIVAKLAGLVR